MAEKTLFFAVVILVFGLYSGCSYYKIVRQTGNITMNQYREINVGWLDLGEQKYKEYGYDEYEQGDWISIVRGENLTNLPQYLKDILPGRKINTAKDINETNASAGLVIYFTDVDYERRTSTAGIWTI